MLPGWPDLKPSIEEIRQWIGQGRNLGWIQDSVATLDFDEMSKGREFWKEHGPFRCAIQITRRGVHLIFSNPHRVGNAVDVNGLYDVRGNGGYIVCPGSRVNKHTYHFVEGYHKTDPGELEPFREEWMPQNARCRVAEFAESGDMTIRAREYLKRVEIAVSGNSGHNATFYAACCLIQKFRLSIDQAWPLMLEYNDRCAPPWSAKDLRRKLEEAERLKSC